MKPRTPTINSDILSVIFIFNPYLFYYFFFNTLHCLIHPQKIEPKKIKRKKKEEKNPNHSDRIIRGPQQPGEAMSQATAASRDRFPW